MAPLSASVSATRAARSAWSMPPIDLCLRDIWRCFQFRSVFSFRLKSQIIVASIVLLRGTFFLFEAKIWQTIVTNLLGQLYPSILVDCDKELLPSLASNCFKLQRLLLLLSRLVVPHHMVVRLVNRKLRGSECETQLLFHFALLRRS